MESIEPTVDADWVIEHFDLAPHPEGGSYRELWRDHDADGGRGAGTSILFLLRSGERSHWHRVDADEHWFFHRGAPLALRRSPADETVATVDLLGVDFAAGHHPQLRVPAHTWQSAETTGAWTLVSCTVSPAFDFAGFELAAPGFEPGGDVPPFA